MTDTTSPFEIDTALLDDPISFMEADHGRIAAVCDRLQALIKDLRHQQSHEEATALVTILTRDLLDHIADEEDLFNLLENSGKADKKLTDIIRVLRAEHAADHGPISAISAELKRFVAGDDMHAPAKFFVNAASFAENQRRHLTWENCTVLPMSRDLLSTEELAGLSTQMKNRRNR